MQKQMTHLKAFLLLSPVYGHGVWLFELIIPPLVPAALGPFPPIHCLRSGFHLLLLTL